MSNKKVPKPKHRTKIEPKIKILTESLSLNEGEISTILKKQKEEEQKQKQKKEVLEQAPTSKPFETVEDSAEEVKQVEIIVED